MLPFLMDASMTFGKRIRYVITSDGVSLYDEDTLLFSIDAFATYCTTGTSQKLTARLDVTLYTVDAAHTKHSWVSVIPKPRFGLRRHPVYLDQEVQRLIQNDIYPELTRDLLFALMCHLCVGSIRLKRNAIRVVTFMKLEFEGIKAALS